MKAIAQGIAENTEYNRFRTVNCRLQHVGLFFEPYLSKGSDEGSVGRLYIFKSVDSPFQFKGLMSSPDSAHRQEGDIFFVNKIVKAGKFSPLHAGFTPESYDLILHITLIDEQGEGEAHYEHNELITKSTATRRSFLEHGQKVDENWVVHEIMNNDSVIRDLVEVYEKSISANSPKLVTFSTLAKGIAEGWSEDLPDKQEVAKLVGSGLKMLREEVREFGPISFAARKQERATKLYSQAIVLRAMLRVLADLHNKNVQDEKIGDWGRWRPTIAKLRDEYVYKDESGNVIFKGEFLSRSNPLFYVVPGASIYQMNKKGREEKEAFEAAQAAKQEKETFVVDPLKHLTVQNTRLSLDAMYGHLRTFLGYNQPKQVAVAAE